MTTAKATTTTKTKATEMDAWTMATSCLTGLRQATLKARSEYDGAIAAAGNNHLGLGVMKANRLLNAIAASSSNLEIELAEHSRANRLSMPEMPASE